MSPGGPGGLGTLMETLHDGDLHRRRGSVTELIGLVVEATGLDAEVGVLCEVDCGRTRPPIPAEVVGFRSGHTLLMPLGELHGVHPAAA